jgi:peptidoglycan/xylan/chitin deacetylase (PgdA/CDA1 family)
MPPALVAITLDLEMSRDYPRRGMTEWDYRKGDLDDDTKQYAVEAGRVARRYGAVIHYFCVGRVLEQPDVSWLKDLHAAGHPIGNHTYDHVNVLARKVEETQFRFQRAPWLVQGMTAQQVIRENIALTNAALAERCQIRAAGFRTPGGFSGGLSGREDVQRMLLDLGFRWVSSKYPAHPTGLPKQEPTSEIYDAIVAAQRDSQPSVYSTGLVEVPMSPISDVNAFRSNFWKLSWFLDATRRSLDWTIRSGAVFDLLAHPSCLVVEDPKFEIIHQICQQVRDAGAKAQFADLNAIAQRAGAADPER